MGYKNFRKSILGIVAILALIVLAACGNNGNETAEPSVPNNNNNNAPAETTPSVEPVELVFTAWNDQVQNRFNAVVELPDHVSVRWIINPNEGNVYQNELIRMLPLGQIDMFVVEVDHIAQFTDSDLIADVRALGLTDADLAYMFDYTLDVATGADGTLRGVAWEANPGLFIYRRSIAMDVFGTDDPEVMQGYLANWDLFTEAARRVSEAGHLMVAGHADTYRTFSNNLTASWVNANNEVIIDPHMMTWVEQTKYFAQNGFLTPGDGLWSSGWSQGVNPDEGAAGVFGYFHAPWGISFVMRDQSLDNLDAPHEVGNGTFGDWAAVPGPEGFFWGGTWIMAYSGSPHAAYIADIMRQLTVDADNLTVFTNEFGDFVNNRAVVEAVANDPDFAFGFLGGQNHIALLADAVDTIDMSHVGPFDQAITEAFQGAMGDYIEGIVTIEEALDNFFSTVTTLHPHLRRPAN